MATDIVALLNGRWLAALGLGMVHSLWQATLIAAVAALILREIRGASRYVVAYTALMLIPGACALTVWRISSGVASPLAMPFIGLESMASWLGCAWIAGIGAASLRLAAGWLRLQRLRASAMPAPETWQSAVDVMRRRLGIARAVRLVETRLADVPGVIGWVSPMLLFPAGLLAGLPSSQVQLIVAHELAHVRRNDYLWNLVQTAIETVFFFHPAVWWLSNRVRAERELCCDDVVVAEFSDRRLYAEALMSIEQHRARGQANLAVAAGGGDLLARIQRLIDKPQQVSSRGMSPVGASSALLMVIAMVSVGLAATGSPAATAALSSAWVGAVLGLMVGMRHALEPDHLVAVSTLVADERGAAQGARLGLAWGLGHTLTLLIVASGLALVRVTVPDRALEFLEAGVGVMLIVLGVRALHSARAMATTGPRTAHAHGFTIHTHSTSADHVHLGPLALARRPLFVGMVHGLAGSGALAAMAMATLPTFDVQVVFIVLFGLGSTIGMAALSGLAGLPLAHLARRPVAFALATAAAGIISMIAGAIWIGGGSRLAQGNTGSMAGSIVDTTGGRLPGVSVVLSRDGVAQMTGVTSAAGRYEITSIPAGRYDVTFNLFNFGPHVKRGVDIAAGQPVTLDVALHLTLRADVTVTGKQSLCNLADVADPRRASLASPARPAKGQSHRRQILERPIMRAGEVLETVPGLVISQHSGEGKANQYYLRGFNLDHGTDFATTIAGIPVNMPTHGHGHGYTDANFLIPELVSGVQFKKGPYYAEEGDFSAAGAVNVNYVNFLSGRSSKPAAAGRDGGACSAPRRRALDWPPAGGLRAESQRRSVDACRTTTRK